MTNEALAEILQKALESDHGIWVECSDPDRLKRKLWRLCKQARDAGNESFESLTFTNDPEDSSRLNIRPEVEEEAP